MSSIRYSKERNMLSELSRNIAMIPVKTEDQHSSFRRRMHKNYVTNFEKLITGSRSNSKNSIANLKASTDQLHLNINSRIFPSYRYSVKNAVQQEDKGDNSMKQETTNVAQAKDAIDYSSFNSETQNALMELQNLIDENTSDGKAQQTSQGSTVSKSRSGMLQLSKNQNEGLSIEQRKPMVIKKSESLSKFMQFKTNNLKISESGVKEIAETSELIEGENKKLPTIKQFSVNQLQDKQQPGLGAK